MRRMLAAVTAALAVGLALVGCGPNPDRFAHDVSEAVVAAHPAIRDAYVSGHIGGTTEVLEDRYGTWEQLHEEG
ncbi:hypothetical protein CLV46_2558 [Diaminobutyricimonas aerilata]|uniref:Uncharacterized protein n=1 Tax=Diaminobutyricimonas aerilata TaxID=1162967 RepID=A0A2M9CM85_9MICO|nr:hypothetical protein [Diaminobutyricimonas aerilata]PJJ72978.1 hypothetical protein CLV46_2558 [Diaminobutyricimonas aerilata]